VVENHGFPLTKLMAVNTGLARLRRLRCVHLQDDSAFRFRTQERIVKTLNFDVGKNRPKFIGYNSIVPWTTAKHNVSCIMHASTTTETLVKIGSVVVEIFREIGRFCRIDSGRTTSFS